MEIQENIKLADFTTFHIGGPAKFFCIVRNLTDLKEALNFAKQKSLSVFILGAGSNILISDTGYSGLVIKIEIKGLEILAETDEHAKLKVSAGENWDEVVAFAIKKHLWGIENLSHIPGNVGAFAVQNVGAYGQEASQVVESVEVLDLTDQTVKTLSNEQCEFSYRRSIFNNSNKDQYIILSVVIVLSKHAKPNFSYGDLKNYFADSELPSLVEIRNAVIEIRDKKFPFPREAKNGSAGSFFRGPLLNGDQFTDLNKKLENLLAPPDWERFKKMIDKLLVPQGYKTPAGFLIEVCGFAGLQNGGAIVNPDQAAIILNATGEATAQEVVELFKTVQQGVYDKTGVMLEHEPEFVGMI